MNRSNGTALCVAEIVAPVGLHSIPPLRFRSGQDLTKLLIHTLMTSPIPAVLLWQNLRLHREVNLSRNTERERPARVPGWTMVVK
jgi:hypothetical protein